MNKFNIDLCADIAVSIGLTDAAFIEKDYYAVQLLKLMADLDLQDWDVYFAGGTCLAKAHLQTFRMSEDLDLKFIPKSHVLKLTNNQKKNLNKKFKENIITTVEHSGIFQVLEAKSRNEGAYRNFLVSYPKRYMHDALRAELKLEFTQREQFFLEPILRSIGSIYARETQQPDEITAFLCDQVETIFAEKFLSLLRRTAEASRGYLEGDDTLIRHVYDLYLIGQQGYDLKIVKSVFGSIVEQDRLQFGNRHKEFKDNPLAELRYGLEKLLSDSAFSDQYRKFLGPLVYSINTPPTWQQGTEFLKKLAIDLLKKIT